jgi:hypothetical protein
VEQERGVIAQGSAISQVDPLPHQMDAVYAHLLTQSQIRFLIADDVTPANLADLWRRELQDKFGEVVTVDQRPVTKDQGERTNPRQHFVEENPCNRTFEC